MAWYSSEVHGSLLDGGTVVVAETSISGWGVVSASKIDRRIHPSAKDKTEPCDVLCIL